jgi:hypothetical protein
MTESDWWTTTDLDDHIDWLFFEANGIDRKFRLFAVACCQRVMHCITLSTALDALEVVERFADDLVDAETALQARQRVVAAYEAQWGGINTTTTEADACRAVISALYNVNDLHSPFYRSREWYESEDNFPYPIWCAYEAALAAEEDGVAARATRADANLAQVSLLHDIFGPLPFRDVAVPPSWLTSDVVLLARGIYDDKAFDRMPILADALQDAGCDNNEVLNHCRDANQVHVRGCWVIDLLLGRPWRESP